MTLIARWSALVLLLLIATSWQIIPGRLAVNVLVGTKPYFVLDPKEYLSVSGKYYFVMQPDCRLVLYNSSSGQPLLATGFDPKLYAGYRVGIQNCSLVMQSDGNLVMYNITRAQYDWANTTWVNEVWAKSAWMFSVWSQGFFNVFNSHSFLLLDGDGRLEYYFANGTRFSGFSFESVAVIASSMLNYSSFNPNSNGYKAWQPDKSLDEFPYMPAGYFLSAGKRLVTTNSAYMLDLNATDCNLRLLNGTRILWQSNTLTSSKNRACLLELQQNGFLQIRDQNSSAVYWNSTKAGNIIVSWILKVDPDNGSLSVSDITNSSKILWTVNPDPAPSAPANAQALAAPTKSDRPILWIVVGVLGGAIFLVAMAALGLYFYARESRFLDPADKAFQTRLTSQAMTEAQIKQATSNYANLLGRGGFGSVYYGKLPDGQEVAAKVLSSNSHQSKHEFYNEVELLSKVHHKHLVALLGYCCTRKHQILIYDYIGGGDLRHRLRGESGAGNSLSWRQRTSIILQVAEGLDYLHDKCSPSIIHRDIKSDNILLTNKLVAKVADFGLSKLKTIEQEDATHITTKVKGTPGYLDPEYHVTGMLTEKSDVYAFGIVMMEILTGLPVIGENHVYIAQKVGDARRLDQFNDLEDPNMGLDFNREEFVNLVEVALWCVKSSCAERPFMRQVVRRLHDLGLASSSESSQPENDVGHEESEIMAMRFNSSQLITSESSASEATVHLSASSSNSPSL
ncbi:hypothetical protein M758_11G152600 [Ceratodon purpureus]|nr:hypothetical protein M758_11G152600 [Ceratodon purpureus]